MADFKETIGFEETATGIEDEDRAGRFVRQAEQLDLKSVPVKSGSILRMGTILPAAGQIFLAESHRVYIGIRLQGDHRINLVRNFLK